MKRACKKMTSKRIIENNASSPDKSGQAYYAFENKSFNNMKTIILVMFVLLISNFSNAQNINTNAHDLNGMKLVPGGSLQIEEKPGKIRTISIDDFWISNEITNKEFRIFYNTIKDNPNDSIAWIDYSKINFNKSTTDKKIPKSVIIKTAYKDIFDKLIDISVSNSIPDKKNYFTDSKYDNYPVIGVNYYGAMYYCIWKSSQENKSNAKGGIITDYRLPTQYEWLHAFSFKTLAYDPEIDMELHEVSKGQKNEIDIFNMNSNVSEWTSTKHDIDNSEHASVLGSSWKTEDRDVSNFISIVKATDYIGFRIIRSDF